MDMRRMGALLGIVAFGLAAGWWVSLPPDTLVLDSTCEPDNGPPRLSAAVWGSRFWAAQLAALTDERDRLLSQPGRRERIKQEMEKETAAEQRMERLSRDDERGLDPAERERRAQREQRHRLERLSWLINCEPVVRSRAGLQ
ncbi:MAG: hypothetical protein ACM31L_08115 [Actinomycetota bacterium]